MADKEIHPTDKAVGERLRAARTMAKMSLDTLGKKVGVTYQQIQKYETGHNRISASVLHGLAKALDLKVSDLLPADPEAPATDFRAERLVRDMEGLPEAARTAVFEAMASVVKLARISAQAS